MAAQMSKKERMEQATKVFESMDSNSDGFIDKREIQTHLKTAQREGKLAEGKKIKDEVASFFSVDQNDDGRVDLDEYKLMWTPSKKGKLKGKKGNASDSGPASTLTQALEAIQNLAESARKKAKESPYVAVSGITVMSACLYVGGMAARIW